MISLDDFLVGLEEDQAKLCLKVRHCILDTFPEIEEKISWKVPFFYWNGPLVYINKSGKKGMYCGFVRGNELNEFHDILNKHGRKQIWSLDFSTTSRFDPETLRIILLRALELNEKRE